MFRAHASSDRIKSHGFADYVVVQVPYNYKWDSYRQNFGAPSRDFLRNVTDIWILLEQSIHLI